MSWSYQFVPHIKEIVTNLYQFLVPASAPRLVTKAVVLVCVILSGMVYIKEPLLLIDKSSLVAAAGFLSRYLSGP